jgi:molybdate transport system substrate-binding protein
VKKIVPALLAIVLLVIAAAPVRAAASQELTVSAAISLKNAFTDIGAAFETQHARVKVLFNFGASGGLREQIRAGAPADLFASAALKDMDILDADGLMLRDSRVDFVSNAMVLIRPSASKVVVTSFDDLRRPEVAKIAVGDPVSVPAGRYADEVLRSLGLADVLRNKLVFAGNVRQVLDYVVRNEVDAGMVYATDAKTLPGDVVVVARAPESTHKPILYPIAVVKGSMNEATAREFISFLRSGTARSILERCGFTPLR